MTEYIICANKSIPENQQEQEAVDLIYSIAIILDGDTVIPLYAFYYKRSGNDTNSDYDAILDAQFVEALGIYDFNSDGLYEICIKCSCWEWGSLHVFLLGGEEVLRAHYGM